MKLSCDKYKARAQLELKFKNGLQEIRKNVKKLNSLKILN